MNVAASRRGTPRSQYRGAQAEGLPPGLQLISGPPGGLSALRASSVDNAGGTGPTRPDRGSRNDLIGRILTSDCFDQSDGLMFVRTLTRFSSTLIDSSTWGCIVRKWARV